jgi:hypothetical protein
MLPDAVVHPEQRETQAKRYTSHEVTAARAGRPSGRTSLISYAIFDPSWPENMKIASILRTSIFVLVASIASAQSQNPRVDQPFPHFTQAAGQTDEDGFPTSGAKLCILGKPGLCYQMPSYSAETGSVTYDFGLDPHTQRLPLPGGGSWIFFTGTFSGGGSGTLTRLATLRYNDKGEIANLLPFIAVTNVSDYAMWMLDSVSPFPILVKADFVWGKGETHFASHFYTVEAWKFDPKSDNYKKAISYVTSRKYAGGDSSPVRVLKPEREQIIARLKSR